MYLTNRFHIAVHVFSNRMQMTSKCGKNKNVAQEAISKCVEMFDDFVSCYFMNIKKHKKMLMTSSVHLFSNRS